MSAEQLIYAALLVTVALPVLAVYSFPASRALRRRRTKVADETIPMRGFNRLDLCPAEMQVAMQEYVNKRFGTYAPSVAAVTFESSSGRFIVNLTDNPPSKAK
mgnify:CR=1 FL=1